MWLTPSPFSVVGPSIFRPVTIVASRTSQRAFVNVAPNLTSLWPNSRRGFISHLFELCLISLLVVCFLLLRLFPHIHRSLVFILILWYVPCMRWFLNKYHFLLFYPFLLGLTLFLPFCWLTTLLS